MTETHISKSNQIIPKLSARLDIIRGKGKIPYAASPTL